MLGGLRNIICSSGVSVIGSGFCNTIFCGVYSTICNGVCNSIINNSNVFFGGGACNTVGYTGAGFAQFNTVIGGVNNTIRTYSGGGTGASAATWGDYNLIGSGVGNVLKFSKSSTILNGGGNTIDQVYLDCGKYVSILGGTLNCVYDSCYNIIVGGDQNCSSKSDFSFIGGGVQNTTAEAEYSSIAGGYLALASLYGQRAFASGGFDNEAGSAQQIDLIARVETLSTVTTEFYLNGTTEMLSIPSDHAWFVTINVAGLGDGYHGASHQIRKVAIVNNGSNTQLIGSVSTIGTDIVQGWLSLPTLTISADNANDALDIKIQAYNSERTRWVAHVEGVQVKIGGA
jgi:hypothetical protein